MTLSQHVNSFQAGLRSFINWECTNMCNPTQSSCLSFNLVLVGYGCSYNFTIGPVAAKHVFTYHGNTQLVPALVLINQHTHW